jgi:asparagine synthase (glutamine-hydrolysing)
MCGILCYLNKDKESKIYNDCKKRIDLLKPRGPEKYSYVMPNKNLYLGFQRLKINDLSELGDQPFDKKDAVMICNGEIYNHKELKEKYDLKPNGSSDCEVILLMYLKFGIKKTLDELDGVFAFVIYDKHRNEIIAGRDSYGVKPLFMSETDEYLVFASELKALYGLKKVRAFPPGSFWFSTSRIFNVFSYKHKNVKRTTLPTAFRSFMHVYDVVMDYMGLKKRTRQHLHNAVRKRLQSDRKIGCMLSGGLDSSLVTAIVKKYSKENVVTYSIGLENSLDLENARKVAKHLGTEHHEVIFSEKTGLDAIPNVIYATETWDTTTIRASVPMYLLSKYISENTPEVKVILSGEGADEVCQGYLYFHNQPNCYDGHDESVRLLEDLYYYDVLRVDRCTAAFGLEVRVPFLDREFLNNYMSIPRHYRCPDKKKGEKWLLREVFEDDNILPPEILWRRKDGLSDGCSSIKRPWYKIIQERAELEISDEEFKNHKYTHCPPRTKESLMYRKYFEKFFPEKDRDKIIPYEWLPKWSGDMINPSGRLIGAFDG